ncbi:MAG: ABC transporter permease [Rhodospirillaceae bacterium]|nr:ABC transporter permease [Rhodospirillaceae bacterium]
MSGGIIGVIARRILIALPIIVLASILVFVVLRLIPADPVAMSVPPNATRDEVEQVRRDLGLDRPIPEQYLIWAGKAAVGEFGKSIAFAQPVLRLIGQTLPATIELVVLAAIFATILGLAGGMLMHALRGGFGEQVGDIGSTLLMSIPEFLWAIFLILLFGVAFDLLPFSGRLDPSISVPKVTGFLLIDCLINGRLDAFVDALTHMLLPSLALAFGTAPLLMRVLRSSLMEVANEDYIVMARLRGLPERQILMRHAFKNAFLPTLTLMGVQFSFLFGGTLLVEVIYAYPGIGNMMVEAVRNTDLPIIQGVALVYALAVLVINLAVDVLVLLLNPKLRVPR